MKALATQICEIQDALTAKKIPFVEAVKPTKSEEQRLSVLKSLLAENGIKESEVGKIIESARSRKITRNNGRGVQADNKESLTETRILGHMKRTGSSFRESSIIMSGVDPGPGAPLPKNIVESLIAAWKKYLPTIKDAEARSLAERGIEP